MPRETNIPDVELIEPGTVRVKCRKCGTLIRLEFGDLTRAEAAVALAKQNYPRECPGFHTELSGWDWLWHFDEALNTCYGPSIAAITDYAMIHLRADGPVSRASIRQWLAEQVPGMTKENVAALTEDFLAQAVQAGLIRVYDDMPDVYEVNETSQC
jgi:hypothetical protein